MTNDQQNPNVPAENDLREAPVLVETNGGAKVEAAETDREGAEQISPKELAELRAKAQQAAENWDKYVRVSADLENYKKRAARERLEASRYASESLVEKLLPIVDNFEAALAAADSPQGANVESLKTGVKMIYSQLKNFLAEAGVEEIDAVNKPFDPNLHEAVSQEVAADVPEGRVLRQMRKGYRFRERLIRPAMVVVAKKP